MKKHLFLALAAFVLVASAATAAANTDAATKDAKSGKAPAATMVKSEKGEVKARTCFRDANKDGACDNSVKAGGKCKNNCVAVPPDKSKDQKAGKKVTSLCEGCPFLASCVGTCKLIK
ncbi:MAG: hypothetical protein AB7F32_07180 [Victivallaceae bacterium]